MDGAIALYAREQADGFQPLPSIPTDEYSEYISYIFLYFTGEVWQAELLIDPMYLETIDPAWPALVKELNTSILSYFHQNDLIGGYYPICTSKDPAFESPYPCLRLVKRSGMFANDVLVPDVRKNYDRLSLHRIQNMTEIQDVLSYLQLPTDDMTAALQNTPMSEFAYLSQLAILKVVPFHVPRKMGPHIVDADGKLVFQQGSVLTCSDAFAAFMNEFFFANLYEGYQYLAGEYPILAIDVDECLQRTMEPLEQGELSLEDVENPDQLLQGLAQQQRVTLKSLQTEFCFSHLLKPEKHYALPDTDVATIDIQQTTHYVETWCCAVAKRCYLISLLESIAYTAACSAPI